MPEHAWETRLQCTALAEGEWDGLLTGVPGRFLWLRVHMRGNGRTTPRFDNIEIEFPRISLRRYLRRCTAPSPGAPTSPIGCSRCSTVSCARRSTTSTTCGALFDPLSTPDLAWLAGWIGIELDRQIPEALQRQLVKRWAETAALHGTRYGLWRVLLVYLGLDALTTACQCAAGPGTCEPAHTDVPAHTGARVDVGPAAADPRALPAPPVVGARCRAAR